MQFDQYRQAYLLSHSCLVDKPEVYFEFHRQKMDTRSIKPNRAHEYLAKLEQEGKLIGVVTQNIDGLHQKAGSKKVLELHGAVSRNYCMDCGAFYDEDAMLSFKEEWQSGGSATPHCPKCGGVIKPDVVLYEEGLDSRTLEESVSEISRADVLIIGGTSLVVYPAAGLIDYFRGDHLVLVNKSATSRDSMADLVIADSIGEVFSKIHV
jgi:NAD-dependent deacetylase